MRGRPIKIEVDGEMYEFELANMSCDTAPMGSANEQLVSITVKTPHSKSANFTRALVRHFFGRTKDAPWQGGRFGGRE